MRKNAYTYKPNIRFYNVKCITVFLKRKSLTNKFLKEILISYFYSIKVLISLNKNQIIKANTKIL